MLFSSYKQQATLQKLIKIKLSKYSAHTYINTHAYITCTSILLCLCAHLFTFERLHCELFNQTEIKLQIASGSATFFTFETRIHATVVTTVFVYDYMCRVARMLTDHCGLVK